VCKYCCGYLDKASSLTFFPFPLFFLFFLSVFVSVFCFSVSCLFPSSCRVPVFCVSPTFLPSIPACPSDPPPSHVLDPHPDSLCPCVGCHGCHGRCPGCHGWDPAGQALNKKENKGADSPELETAITLTPRTEEKYKQINEEFDQMIKTHKIPVSTSDCRRGGETLADSPKNGLTGCGVTRINNRYPANPC